MDQHERAGQDSMNDFIKNHWAGVFLLSVFASLVAAVIYDHISLSGTIAYLTAKAEGARPANAGREEGATSPGETERTAKRKGNALALTTYVDIDAEADRSYFGSLNFSPDSSALALGTSGGPIEMWDMELKIAVRPFVRPTSDSANAVSFSPDGSFLVGGYDDNTLKIWDTRTQSLLRTLIFGNDVKAVDYSNDGTLLAAVGFSNPVKIWNTSSWVLSHELSVGSDWYDSKKQGRKVFLLGFYNKLSFSPDDRYVAASYYCSTRCCKSYLRIWEVSTKTIALEVPVDSLFRELAFSPNGRHVLWLERESSKNQGGRLFGLDFHGKKEKLLLSSGIKAFVFLSGESDSVLALSASGATVWDLTAGTSAPVLFGGIASSIPITNIDMSPDGRFLAASLGGANIDARIWEIQK